MSSSSPGNDQPGLNTVLNRNIGALLEKRRAAEANATLEERIAQTITRWAGSMRFVYVHAAALALWIGWNLGAIGLAPFDPTFVILATAASVEAIFLSTFILISQNRSTAAAERRAELDLHVSLLTEHEVTRVLQMVSLMADRLDVQVPQGKGLDELKRDIAPEKVLDKIEQTGRREDR
jgi:uncharacterized membrane protein